MILIILFVLIISGCVDRQVDIPVQIVIKYECFDGSVVDNIDLCKEQTCPELDYSKCPQQKCPDVNCSKCPKQIKTVKEYVCPDGKTTVTSVSNCPTKEEVMMSGDYDFIPVNLQTKRYSTYGNTRLNITLEKIGIKKYGDVMRVRPYWRLENIGTNILSVYPHQHTIILDGFGGQYESDLISMERESDDFHVGGSTGGDLRPGVIADGGVSVDNLPASAKNLQIILEIAFFEDIKYYVDLNHS